MHHLFDHLGVPALWQLALLLALLFFLHALADILVQPELDGGRALLWGLLALALPFVGPVLWYVRGPRTLRGT